MEATNAHPARSRYGTTETSPLRRFVLFEALVIARLLNSLSIRTFFQPDEYFQSLEPAWQLAFGADSKAWITWVSPYVF